MAVTVFCDVPIDAQADEICQRHSCRLPYRVHSNFYNLNAIRHSREYVDKRNAFFNGYYDEIAQKSAQVLVEEFRSKSFFYHFLKFIRP